MVKNKTNLPLWNLVNWLCPEKEKESGTLNLKRREYFFPLLITNEREREIEREREDLNTLLFFYPLTRANFAFSRKSINFLADFIWKSKVPLNFDLINGQEYNLFSIVIFGTLIMSPKGNGTINLRHLKKESGTTNLRWRDYFPTIGVWPQILFPIIELWTCIAFPLYQGIQRTWGESKFLCLDLCAKPLYHEN